MEESRKPLWRVSLNYGLITGLIVIIFSLILYLLDLSTDPDAWYINMIIYLIMIGGMVWGARSFRDENNAGFATYGQAFSAAFLVGLFAAILSAVYTYLLYQLNPALIEQAILIAEEQLYEQQGLSGDQLDQALEMQRRFTSPLMISVLSLVWTTIINVVLALIIAIFIKREDPSLQTGV